MTIKDLADTCMVAKCDGIGCCSECDYLEIDSYGLCENYSEHPGTRYILTAKGIFWASLIYAGIHATEKQVEDAFKDFHDTMVKFGYVSEDY